MIGRIAAVAPDQLVRLRIGAGVLRAYCVLPSTALVERAVRVPGPAADESVDVTVTADDLLAWAAAGSAVAAGAGGAVGLVGAAGVVGAAGAEGLQRRDAQWRGALPPDRGWRRLDVIPESVITGLVADGAAAHRELERRGLSARAAQELLDQVVLDVRAADDGSALPTAVGPAPLTPAALTAAVTNRSLVALKAMAFIPPAGVVSVARAGRWTRLSAAFGSVYAEASSGGLSLH